MTCESAQALITGISQINVLDLFVNMSSISTARPEARYFERLRIAMWIVALLRSDAAAIPRRTLLISMCVTLLSVAFFTAVARREAAAQVLWRSDPFESPGLRRDRWRDEDGPPRRWSERRDRRGDASRYGRADQDGYVGRPFPAWRAPAGRGRRSDARSF